MALVKKIKENYHMNWKPNTVAVVLLSFIILIISFLHSYYSHSLLLVYILIIFIHFYSFLFFFVLMSLGLSVYDYDADAKVLEIPKQALSAVFSFTTLVAMIISFFSLGKTLDFFYVHFPFRLLHFVPFFLFYCSFLNDFKYL